MGLLVFVYFYETKVVYIDNEKIELYTLRFVISFAVENINSLIIQGAVGITPPLEKLKKKNQARSAILFLLSI